MGQEPCKHTHKNTNTHICMHTHTHRRPTKDKTLVWLEPKLHPRSMSDDLSKPPYVQRICNGM